jgi:hypothetical protein
VNSIPETSSLGLGQRVGKIARVWAVSLWRERPYPIWLFNTVHARAEGISTTLPPHQRFK